MPGEIRALQGPLWANAVFSSVSGLLLVLMPGWWAARIGLAPAWLLAALGVGLVVFAGVVLWASALPERRRGVIAAIIAADLGWVLATPVVLAAAGSGLSAFGQVLLAGVAAAVALLALLQWLAWRQLAGRPRGAGAPG